MNKDDVEVIEVKRAFQGYFALDQYRLRHALFAGGFGSEIRREVFERGHAAAIVPYDPHRDQVVLIEQFRPGAFAAGDPSPWLIEVVAGIIDPGETPEDVCRREAIEEAGLKIERLVHLSTQFMTPGGSSETIALFVGECDSTNAAGLYGLADEGEDIRVFVASFNEAVAMVLDGRIRNAMTSIAILQLFHRHADLREAWQRPI